MLGSHVVSNNLSDAENLTAQDLISFVVQDAREQGRTGELCLTSSFQAEDMAVLHMLRQQVPDINVIFLETGYHFPALLEYRDRIVSEWNLKLVNALPQTSLKDHEAQHGLLHVVNPGQCCQIRKVEPLMRSLDRYTYWFTGLRREQSPTRAGLAKLEEHRLPSGKMMCKVSALADWVWSDVLGYLAEHKVPRLSLYELGYTSIGCEPCTAVPQAGADPRSGRWGGKKLECGIHTFSETQ